MEVKVREKNKNEKSIKNQRSTTFLKKRVDCGTMLINIMSGAGWKNATHPMNRMTNWCIGGCWFTLVGKQIAHRDFGPLPTLECLGPVEVTWLGQVGHFAVVAHLCVTGAATNVVSFLERERERRRRSRRREAPFWREREREREKKKKGGSSGEREREREKKKKKKKKGGTRWTLKPASSWVKWTTHLFMVRHLDEDGIGSGPLC